MRERAAAGASIWRNSIVGAVGGLILGQILSAIGLGEPGMATAEGAPAAGGMDVGALIGQIVGGGVGGAVLTLIIGAIKNMMGGRPTT